MAAAHLKGTLMTPTDLSRHRKEAAASARNLFSLVQKEFSEGDVGTLVSCGFGRGTAEAALERCANVEEALEECLRIQAANAPKMEELSALGFSEQKARIALEKNGNDLTRAADWLMTNNTEEDPLSLLASPASFRHPKTLANRPPKTPERTKPSDGNGGTQRRMSACFKDVPLPTLRRRRLHDDDMIARMEEVEKTQDYEAKHLTLKNVIDRRAHSARIHSAHFQSLLSFGIAATPKKTKKKTKKSKQQQQAGAAGEEAVIDAMVAAGFGKEWAMAYSLGITAEHLAVQSDEGVELDVRFNEEDLEHLALSDAELAEDLGFSDLSQAAAFRAAALAASRGESDEEIRRSSVGAAQQAGGGGGTQEMLTVEVDVTQPLGITVALDLVVDGVNFDGAEHFGAEDNARTLAKAVKPGYKLLAVGGFAVSNALEFKSAVRQLKAQDGGGSREGAVRAPLLFSTIGGGGGDDGSGTPRDEDGEDDEEEEEGDDDDLLLPSQPPPPPTLAHELSREELIVAGKRRLEGRLGEMGLKEVIMEDDGNCQFRALSAECFGTQEWHQGIRRRVADHIAAHDADFRPFFSGAEAFDEYVSHMRESGTWGDELTLRAAADLLRVRVFVVTSEEENWLLHYDPGDDAAAGAGGGGEREGAPNCERCLFVTYVSPIHYNTVEHLPPSHALYRKPTYETAAAGDDDQRRESSGGAAAAAIAGRQVWL